MDVLSSRTGDRRRRRVRPASVVAAALVLLGAGQVAALSRTPPLPNGLSLRVPLENYFLTERPGGGSVQFELRNEGDRQVRVLGVGEDVPGLRLEDVSAAGEPFGFRSVGGGEDPLPAFELGPGVSAVVTLVYRRVDCADLPRTDVAVPVRAAVGRARGRLLVRLAPLPDDGPTARPDDVVAWQTALVRGGCGRS